MSASKKTGNGAGKAEKGNGSKGRNTTTNTSNLATKANVRNAIGGIEVEMDDGWMPAVYLDEIRARVLQDTETEGSYDHPPTKGKLALDITAFHPDHKSWGESRDQRPKILFEYKRTGREDPDYEVGIWIDNGRVVLGPDSLPIRDFHDLPKLCSSQMEGFRMEAISRLDSRISISDFRARMMRDALPGANALSMRKTRFRNRGRCMAWDQRAGTDFFEVNLRKEMTQDMIARNSTEELEDLSSGKVEQLQLETAGIAPARSGKRALPDNIRAQRLKAAKEKNALKLEAEAKLKQENTEEQSVHLETPSRTANPVVSTTKRKTTTKTELAGGNLQQYVDELFGEERPNKKRRTHESSSGSLDVLNAKKRKRTGAQEADLNDDDAADEAQTFKRSRHSFLLDLLPSAFSSTSPRGSLPPPERGYPANDMANTGRPTAAGPVQSVAAWEAGERLAQGGDTLAHERRDAEPHDANRVGDERDIVPVSPRERVRIQNALAPTRRHYEFVTQRVAPETNARDNYLSQWAALQLSFNDVWRETGLADPVPILAGLDRWTPGSLVWNQSTAQLLDLHGAGAQRLFDELQHDLHNGLTQVHNHRAPRGDLAADWQTLGHLIYANGETSGPASAPERSTGDQQLSALDPLAAFEPFAEYQPSAAFDSSATINPAVFGASSSSAPTPALDPFAGFSPTALWEPRSTPTFEAQASFTDALPDHAGRATTAPAVAAPIVGDVTGSSSSPRYSSHLGPDEDFQSWLDSILEEPANAAPQPAVASTGAEEPQHPAFDESFFDDAAAINNRRLDDLFAGAEEPQTVAPPPLPTQQTVRPDELNAPGLAEDFEMFSKGTDFWLS